MDSQAVVLISDFHSSRELRDALATAAQPSPVEGLSLELQKQASPYRIEPTVLVAIISGAATVIPALVAALLLLLRREKSVPGMVRITEKDGSTIEIPADADADQVARILAAVQPARVCEVLLAPR